MHRHTKAGMIMLLSGAMMLNTVTCAFAAGNTDGSPTVLLQGPGAASPAPETSVSDNFPDGSPVIHVGQTEQDETSAGGPGVSSSGTIERNRLSRSFWRRCCSTGWQYRHARGYPDSFR